MIAPTKKIDAIRSGIPFEDIYQAVFAKPVILSGMADINIDEIATIAKKSKKVLIPLFLKIELFILLLLKKFNLLDEYLFSNRNF